MHPPRAGRQQHADNQAKEKERLIGEGRKGRVGSSLRTGWTIKAIRLNNSPIIKLNSQNVPFSLPLNQIHLMFPFARSLANAE